MCVCVVGGGGGGGGERSGTGSMVKMFNSTFVSFFFIKLFKLAARFTSL